MDLGWHRQEVTDEVLANITRKAANVKVKKELKKRKEAGLEPLEPEQIKVLSDRFYDLSYETVKGEFAKIIAGYESALTDDSERARVKDELEQQTKDAMKKAKKEMQEKGEQWPEELDEYMNSKGGKAQEELAAKTAEINAGVSSEMKAGMREEL